MRKPLMKLNLQLHSASNVESLSNPRDSLPNVFSGVTAREIDFVTRFGQTWEALQAIYGIVRPIRKDPGTQLISYNTTIALESGSVDPGEVIPYSKATTVEAAKSDITIEMRTWTMRSRPVASLWPIFSDPPISMTVGVVSSAPRLSALT